VFVDAFFIFYSATSSLRSDKKQQPPLRFIVNDSPSAQLYAALRVLLSVSPCGVRSGRSVVFRQSLRGGSSPFKSTKPKKETRRWRDTQDNPQIFQNGQRY